MSELKIDDKPEIEAELNNDSEPVQKDSEKPKKKKGLRGYIIRSTLLGLVFVLSVTLVAVSHWYKNNYFLEFKDLIYVLTGPIEGTGSSMVNDILAAALPYTITAAAVYTEIVFLLAKKNKIVKYLRAALCFVCSASLVYSLFFTAYAFRFDTFGETLGESTTIYEDYYVDPNSVSITANGKTKNLIYIYLESMEANHTSSEYGGEHKTNYIPNLTQYALNNVSFSTLGQGTVGGFVPINGATWTMAALLSTTSGVPFAFSVEGNNVMDKRDKFAPGLTTIGQVLEKKGYKNVFLCGSDATFGGRQKYFTQHGNYEIYDINDARQGGYIDYFHNGHWGMYDKDLYAMARDRLTELAKLDQPFNFTMLTVDTHPPEGKGICELCGDVYEQPTANTVACADKQVSEFVEWIKQQDFYKDCVIVISGDHLRMDKGLNDDDNFPRRIYNCYINSDVAPTGETFNRLFSPLDMFPTTVASLGFEIEGNRLGLGTNLFAGKDAAPTLVEQMGYETFNGEIAKHSDYYLTTFEYPPEDKD